MGVYMKEASVTARWPVCTEKRWVGGWVGGLGGGERGDSNEVLEGDRKEVRAVRIGWVGN